MFKMDKTFGKAMSHEEAEKEKLFPPETLLKQRLDEAWYLTCKAYGLDPNDPPKFDKSVGSSRKHNKNNG